MIEKKKHPVDDQKDQPGGKQEEVSLSIGNNSGTASQPDQNTQEDKPDETQDNKRPVYNGDNNESDDNGLNPYPAEMDPARKNTGITPPPRIENADEDEQNPYPDELRSELNKDQGYIDKPG